MAMMVTSMHLIAPVGYLVQTIAQRPFQVPFPARAILCMLNGHSVNGESKNHIKIGHMSHSLPFTLAEGDAAILQRSQDIITGEGKSNVPHPKCKV